MPVIIFSPYKDILPVAPSVTYSEQVILDGPYAYYRLNEASGSAAADSSGNGRDGTTVAVLYSDPSLLVGDGDSAYGFNGTDTKITLPFSTSFQTFSLECWFNVQPDTSTWQVLFGHFSFFATSETAFPTSLIIDGSNNLRLNISKGDDFNQDINIGVVVADDTNYHVVATWNGTTASLYLDGALVNTVTTPLTISTYTSNWTIGRAGVEVGDGINQSAFKGTIDEAAIYTIALTPAQVLNHYELGTPPPPSTAYVDIVTADSPIAYWRLGEASGTTAVDEIGSNDGTYINTPTLGDTSLISNDLNTSVVLNGVDEYVAIPLGLRLSDRAAYTINAWIKWDSSQNGTLWSESVAAGIEFGVSIFTDGTVSVSTKSSGTWYSLATSAGALSVSGNIYHIVVTKDATGKNIYINGVLVASDTNILNTTLTPDDIAIGKSENAGGPNVLFKGSVDEVSVYNYGLSLAQVLEHYDAGKIVITGGTPYSDAIISDTPIAYWRLGEASGTSAVDKMGTYDGTYTNTPTLGATSLINESDTAVAFDGDNDFIELGSIASTDTLSLAGSNFSIEAWVKADVTGDDAMRIIDKSDGGGAANGYALYILNDGAIGILISGVTTAYLWSPVGTVTTNVTYHIVATGDGTNYRIYVDGVQVAVGMTSGTYVNPPSTTTNARIGSWNHTTAREFKGTIDELAVYDYALTGGQVLSHYDTGVITYQDTIIADTPIAYWRLGEASGTSAVDEIGSNDGTYTNTPTLGVSSLINESDTAVTFNQANTEYITVPDTNAFSFTSGTADSAFSVEAWINLDTVTTDWGSPIFTKAPTLTNLEYNMYVTSAGGLQIVLYDTTSSNQRKWFIAAGTILPNVTYHVVITYTGAFNSGKIYIDGVDVGTSYSELGTYVSMKNTTAITTIGAEFIDDGTYFDYLDGTMDEIAVYSYALTVGQALAHYDTGKIKTYSDNIIADAPIAYWKLDETSGTSAADTMSTYDGTYVNSPVLGAVGLISIGTAVTFDGGTDYVELGSIASTDTLSLAGSNFSIEAWVKPDLTGDDFMRIIDKSSAGNAANGYTFHINNDGKIGILINGVASLLTPAATVTTNGTYHIVATGDGTNYRIYVDGVQVSSGVTSGTYTNPPAVTTNARIGTWNHSTGREFKGTIDELAVYDYVLSAGAVAQHYSDGSL